MIFQVEDQSSVYHSGKKVLEGVIDRERQENEVWKVLALFWAVEFLNNAWYVCSDGALELKFAQVLAILNASFYQIYNLDTIIAQCGI